MAQEGIDIYIVPTADFHQSEYVGEYFKARQFLTGFTGSAGTAVITQSEACLWTDGRYFLQAAGQLDGTGIRLMKMGEPGVCSVREYIEQVLPEKGVIGFDGRVVSMTDGAEYRRIAEEKGGMVRCQDDLVDRVWKDRPELSGEPVFALEEAYTGESVGKKLGRIRTVMREAGADLHLLTTLDDICWMLNIRGNDVAYTPVVLAYALITPDRVKLYTDCSKYSDEIRRNLEAEGVEFLPYNRIYEDIRHLECGIGKKILLDSARVNYALYANLPEGLEPEDRDTPEILMKAVKNPTEIANIRLAQLKDSVAHIRFMKWLKEQMEAGQPEGEQVTELSASQKLDELREEMGGFLGPSFAPISAYGEHGAIIHYSPSADTDVELKPGTLFLTDTGAGFLEGSTDITRTYALGEIPEAMKEDFTMVLTGNLRLAGARFLKGCTGQHLDILARQPFWERGLDYRHGTGHGVGYLLSIHEGPQSFMWRSRGKKAAELVPGMIITDEPGIYVEGSHGIRLENEVLVCEGEQNEYGQFLYLEPITYVPFDLDAVLPDRMTPEDRLRLNNYHKKVYEMTSPYLSEEEKQWLSAYTRSI